MFWRKGKDGTGTGSGGTGLKQQQQHLVPARQLDSVRLLQDAQAMVSKKGAQVFSTWIGEKNETIDYSYEYIWDRSGAISHYLFGKYGLNKGERVILCYGFGLEFFVAFLACLRLGVVAVPVYPPNPTKLKMSLEKLELIVDSAGAKLCLTDNTVNWFRKASQLNVLSTAKWPRGMKWESTEAILAGTGTFHDEPNLCSDDVAFLQYTSGSTGDPKGVMITFGNLDHNVNDLILFSLRRDVFCNRTRTAEDIESPVGVSWLPQYHDMGLIVGLIMPFVGGFRMYHMSPMTFVKNPLIWIKTMSKVGAHFSTAPNFALGLTARRWKSQRGKQEPLDLSALQFIQLGGEPVNPEHISAFSSTFADHGLRRNWVGPAYGLAEHTVAVSYCTEVVLCSEAAGGNLVACGADFRVDVRIVEPDSLAEIQDGHQGEIWLSSPSCAVGYWGREEATQETFQARMSTPDRPPVFGNGVYTRTGDMGFLQNGHLFICGRIKDLIILRGKNYYPQDIELVVEKASENVRPGCLAAFASSIPGIEDEQVEIVFEWREVKSGTSSKEFMREQMDKIFRAVVSDCGVRMHRIVAIQDRSIPKTTSGKIRRRATRDALQQGQLRVVSEVVLGNNDGWQGTVTEEPTGQETLDIIEATVSPRLALGETASSPLHQIDGVLERSQEEQLRAQLLDSIENKLQRLVLETALGVTGLPHVEIDMPLMDLGLESIMAIEFREKLSTKLGGFDLPDTIIFDYPSIRQIAGYIMHEIFGVSAGGQAGSGTDASSLGRGMEGGNVTRYQPLAVVGMGCRTPGGVDGARAFWGMLLAGTDTVTEIPKDRWDVDGYYHPNPEHPGTMYTRAGAFLDDIESFDAAFFRISEPEALAMDPQQRVLLETSYCAFVDAGYTQRTLLGQDAGVFVGVCSTDFSRLKPSKVGPYTATGASQCVISNRVSFALGLKGPSMSVDTACSSSSVAVHLAARSLQSMQCSVVLAAGVNLILLPDTYVAVCQGRMLAVDGRCKTFDAAANGYVRGEGCGAVVLKRLADAERDGNLILALLRGTAVNQDGRSASLTAPNGPSQQEVILRALSEGSLNPSAVDYIEAHGTGTPLGDPIEVGALKAVFGPGRDPTHPLYVGSVKTNIGHLEGAAGIVGFIKAVLVVQHRLVPSNLHFQTLNPSINLGACPFVFPTENIPLNKAQEERAIAGISSFGFGGTNSHLVVQGWKPTKESAGKDVLRIADFPTDQAKVPVAFLFTGQGSQYVGMGKSLYESEPVFRAVINECDDFLKTVWPFSLIELLYPKDEGVGVKNIHETCYSQPALFAIEMALTALWKEKGVVPDVVMGHSAGEFAAACVAGVFSLADGLRFITERGLLMQSLPTLDGTMFALHARENDVQMALDEMLLQNGVEAGWHNLSIAAVNAPQSVVLAGPRALGEALIKHLNVAATELQVSHAFHSPMMADAAPALRALASSIQLSSPSIPIVSNVTGAYASEGDLTTGEYWACHMMQGVRFYDGMRALQKSNVKIFVEIGPEPVLNGVGRQCVDDASSCLWLHSLKRKGTGDNIKHALAKLSTASQRQSLLSDTVGGSTCRELFSGRQKFKWKDREAKKETESVLFEVEWSQSEEISPVGAWGTVDEPALILDVPDSDGRTFSDGDTSVWIRHKEAAARAPLSEGISMEADFEDGHQIVQLLENRCWGTVIFAGALHAQGEGGENVVRRRVLRIAQAILLCDVNKRPRQFLIITCGAQPCGEFVTEKGARQAWVSGFVKTLRLEHVDLFAHQIDLSADVQHQPVSMTIRQLLSSPPSLSIDEVEVSIRDGRTFVSRLVLSEVALNGRGSMGVVPEATYVITGGLGALGMVFAERLIEEGAENVVLLSRSGASGAAAEAAVEKLRRSKARVEVLKCDVSKRESVRQMFKTVGQMLPPVRGVIHSAGVLDDATVENQTVEKFERVFSSKVDGAWHLHALAEELDVSLDFFVLFSSISSLMGSPGQSNYASANAALDGLAHFRRGRGLPALSVQWGPWASAGMATEKDTVKRLEGQGISGITNEMGVSALSSLMSQEGGIGQAAVLPVSWSKFAARSGGRLPPFFSRVARSDVSAGGASSGAMGAAELLRSIPATGRVEYLRNLVLETAKEVSGNGELDGDA
ncbi:hypothetical protein VYU27_003073, partial [Nannochloropsis oceanica]